MSTPRTSLLPSLANSKTPITPYDLNKRRTTCISKIERMRQDSLQANGTQSVLDFNDSNRIKSQINWYKENFNKSRPLGKPVFYADSFYDLSAQSLNGKYFNFSSLSEHVCLVINVATVDANTSDEFKQLNELVQKYGSKGFVVLAFLCNQFGNTQPFDQYEVLASLKFVRPGAHYEPLFPLFLNCNVNGSFTSLVYEYLKFIQPFPLDDVAILSSDENYVASWSPIQRTDISGNFEKFLIDRNGQVTLRYSHKKESLTDEIEKLLHKRVNLKEKSSNLSIKLAQQLNF